MSLYVYLRMPKASFGSLRGPKADQAAIILQKIEETGLPFSQMKRMREKFLQAFERSDEEKDRAEVTDQWNSIVTEHRKENAAWMNLADFFLFASLWIGLYLCLVSEVLDRHVSIASGSMQIGAGVLLQTVCVYAVFAAAAWILARDTRGWKRWAAFIGLFALYLLSIYAGSKLAWGIQVPVWLVLAACLVTGGLSLYWLTRVYEPEKLMKH